MQTKIKNLKTGSLIVFRKVRYVVLGVIVIEGSTCINVVVSEETNFNSGVSEVSLLKLYNEFEVDVLEVGKVSINKVLNNTKEECKRFIDV